MTRGDPISCGGGVALFINEHNYLHIKEGFTEGSNNFGELNALRLLMTKAWELGDQSIQIFGASKIILNLENGTYRCNILSLTPLLYEVMLLKHHFDNISFSNVYRERNTLAERENIRSYSSQPHHIGHLRDASTLDMYGFPHSHI